MLHVSAGRSCRAEIGVEGNRASAIVARTMTAKINRQGQLVLHTTHCERLDLKSGDALVVVQRDADGHIVLQKRRVRAKTLRGKN